MCWFLSSPAKRAFMMALLGSYLNQKKEDESFSEDEEDMNGNLSQEDENFIIRSHGTCSISKNGEWQHPNFQKEPSNGVLTQDPSLEDDYLDSIARNIALQVIHRADDVVLMDKKRKTEVKAVTSKKSDRFPRLIIHKGSLNSKDKGKKVFSLFSFLLILCHILQGDAYMCMNVLPIKLVFYGPSSLVLG